MNKEYLKYLLTSKRSLLVFIGVINFLFPTLIYFLSLSDGWYYYTAVNTVLYSCALVFIECILLPVIHFSFLHNKKGVDSYFSLPISRKEIYITTYVMIILEIVISHVLATLPVVISEWLLGEAVMYVGQYFFYIIACLFVVSVMVLAVCALLLKTNTVVDTLIMVGSYIGLPLLIYSTLYVFINNQAFGVTPYGLIQGFLTYAFLPITFLRSFPAFFVNMFEEHDYLFNVDDYKVCLVIFVCIGMIALISCMYDMKKRKAEDAEQLSTNIFSYPFIIAMITFTLLLDVIFSEINFSATAIFMVAIFILFSIMVCVYKRKITFTKKSIILFVCTLLLGYTVMFTSSITNAFGLEYSYRNSDTLDTLSKSWNINLKDESFHIWITSQESDDDVIKKEMHGEYVYDDLIDQLHQKQDECLTRYKSNTLKINNDYNDLYIETYFNVQYQVNKSFCYNYYDEINEDRIKNIVEEAKFYDEFSFLNVSIRYNFVNESGLTDSRNISKEEFYTMLLNVAE